MSVIQPTYPGEILREEFLTYSPPIGTTIELEDKMMEKLNNAAGTFGVPKIRIICTCKASESQSGRNEGRLSESHATVETEGLIIFGRNYGKADC